jgi:hypothetical protein
MEFVSCFVCITAHYRNPFFKKVWGEALKHLTPFLPSFQRNKHKDKLGHPWKGKEINRRSFVSCNWFHRERA